MLGVAYPQGPHSHRVFGFFLGMEFRLCGSTVLILGPKDHLDFTYITCLLSPVLDPTSYTFRVHLVSGMQAHGMSFAARGVGVWARRVS